ncbi:MAG: DNA primase [Bacteroidales bacterium]|jgi:DNA primase|nr:DNA primase [Bacteroidales bacterium]MDD3811663.1 DNA primase [Bacteroidales bacterium]
MIDPGTVERILQAAEITDVVGDYVKLKKRGANYIGLCPFHNEKTPSFNVSPARGIYKCFGCGKGGNAVNFIMEHEHLSYPEALKLLAKKYHIEVVETHQTDEDIRQKNDRESMMVVIEYATRYFSRMLLESEEGRDIGISYFKERGFRREIIDRFQLGYSPGQRDALVADARKNGYKDELLIKTGLAIEGNNRLFDRFFGRVIFPIHSLSGRVIGFGGRILRGDVQAAKYLNSPESEIYHKSATLYGIYHARTAIVKSDKCFLVEGYTDVLSMHQSGIENCVASSGTSLTEDQIRLIKRFTLNVTILYDGDPAGIKASLRGIDMLLEQGLHVRVVLLPEGEDPDSFARSHSSTELLNLLNTSESDFITFKARLLMQDAGSDPVRRANLIQEVVRSVSMVPDRIERTVYLQECSKLLGVEEQVLFSEAARLRRRLWEQKRSGRDYQNSEARMPAPRQQASTPSEAQPFETEEREIIRLMLNYPLITILELPGEHKGETLPINVAGFFLQEMESDNLIPENPLYQIIFHEIQSLWGNSGFNIQSHFINHPDPSISKLAVDLLTPGYQISKIHEKAGAYVRSEEQLLREIVPETLASYRSKKVKKMISEIDEQIKDLQGAEDITQISSLLEERRKLDELRKAFSKELRRIII